MISAIIIPVIKRVLPVLFFSLQDERLTLIALAKMSNQGIRLFSEKSDAAPIYML